MLVFGLPRFEMSCCIVLLPGMEQPPLNSLTVPVPGYTEASPASPCEFENDSACEFETLAFTNYITAFHASVSLACIFS